ncbi:MAG: hypothetical protein A2508_05560 [Candidatus Lambdaproteobacteria bacterium RIFOXYD12_FULL_49_8]|nr:MAG: hypothetical protein A2508_05560 [Candidatus Lambdaproteobacteria bacterium RIFOXYD12_FULL_49_8]
MQAEPELKGEITYGLLHNLAEALSIYKPDLLLDYAKTYDPAVAKDPAFYLDLCQRICLLANEEKKEETPPVPDLTFLPELKVLKDQLLAKKDQTLDGEEMQTALFSLAKEKGANPRDWFAFLYAALLQKNQGPKMGPFLAIVGPKKGLELVEQALERLNA